MKTSTTLFTCDICGRKRIDGDLVPEKWSTPAYGFELLCDACVAALNRFTDDRRGLAAQGPIESRSQQEKP